MDSYDRYDVMKAVAIVAHDDDVALWMGGTIHVLNDWEWLIVSMCNDNNKVRRRYFDAVSMKLNAPAISLDFHDYQSRDPSHKCNSLQSMKQELLSVLGSNRYDYVFTHSRNQNGEYGVHANHQEVCGVVQHIVSEKQIVEKNSQIAYFCYSPIYELPGLPTVARQDATFYMQLSYSNLAFKIGLIKLHNEEIVHNLENDLGAPCPNPEAFEGDNLCLPHPFIGKKSW